LREKYSLITITSDKYLGKPYRMSSKARHATHMPYVIKLNPKCAIKPNTEEVKALKGHRLSQEYELMRRVIVEVDQKKADGDGVSLVFHPKLRRNPL
jgi:hypothetical protein